MEFKIVEGKKLNSFISESDEYQYKKFDLQKTVPTLAVH